MKSPSAKGGDSAGARADSLSARSILRSSTGARSPTVAIGFARAILKTNRAPGNLLDFAFISQDGTEHGTGVCARPPELQTAYYDGKTIGGVAYAFVDNTSRTANDGDETTEEIVPSYVADSTILLLQKFRGGTGLVDDDDEGRVVTWQEITFRGWGEVEA